jgi:cytidine deaminase
MSKPIPWEELFEAARHARERAHAPYSRFAVGAAVLTEDGRIEAGANVENASYGLSMCAERNAIGRAVSEGARRIAAVAIVVETKTPCPPCGSCRQVIAEFAAPDAPVRSRTLDGQESRHTVKELLPDAFGPGFF